jgi:H+/Cl- antiporter ClcA
MSPLARKPLQIGLALLIGGGVLMGNESLVRMRTGFVVSQAEARIGRPLTPMSYAGVARRTTRRAVAVGAAAGAAYAYPPPVYAPACYQAVDAYGRVYTRCP